MTTTATNAFTSAVASGVSPIPFTFQAISPNEIGVLRGGVLDLVAGVDFTVILNGDNTGTVTPNVSWGTDTVVIYSKPNFDQPADFTRFGPLYPDQLVPPLDRITRALIALRATALILPLALAVSTSARADRLLGWDAAGAVTSYDVSTVTGPPGAPGGNVMAIGLFNAASATAVPAGADLVRTSGYSAKGIGIADYVYDAAVDAAYVAANPRTSFRDTAGRGFRLSTEQQLAITMFGAQCDTSKFGVGGTDDTAAVQAAVDFLNTRGGGKLLVPGHTRCAGSLNLSGKNHITFFGPGGILGYNAPPAGQLIYTGVGSGPFIDASHSNAVAFKEVGVRYTSATFTGDLIAYTNTSGGSDAAYGLVENCLVGGMYNAGAYVASARSLISLEGAILCQIVGNHFQFAAAAIRGAKEISVGNVLYSNAHNIQRNTFDNVTNAILNAAQSWTVDSNWFEGTNGGAGGMQHAYYSDISAASAAGSTSFAYTNNWHGDKVAGGAWFDNNFMGIRGLDMSGNYFDTGGPTDCVKFASTIQGGNISGNAFSSGIDFNNVGHYGLKGDGNYWSVEPKNLSGNAEDINISANKLNSANAASFVRMFKVGEYRIGYPGAAGGTGTFAYYAGGAVDAEMFVSSDTNRQKSFSLRRGNERRWSFVSTSETESGSSAGSNFQLRGHDDAGTWTVTPLSANRATGDVMVGGVLYPSTDNTKNLGTSGARWATVYAGTGTINTSDRNEKTAIRSLTDDEFNALLDAAGAVKLRAFKFKDAVKSKGKDARDHYGIIAQDLYDEMAKRGLDPFTGGVLGFDPVIEQVNEKYQTEEPVVKTKTQTSTVVEIIEGKVVERRVKTKIKVPIIDLLPVHDEKGKALTVLVPDPDWKPERDPITHRPMGSAPLIEQPRLHEVVRMRTVNRTRKIERPKLDRNGKPVIRWNVRYSEFFALRQAWLERELQKPATR